MVRTSDGFDEWAESHLTPHQGGNWAGVGYSLCEQLVNNAGGFTEAFATAQLAANASGPLNPSTTIPVGHFGYFHDGGAGHVVKSSHKGILMASHLVNSLAPGLGYLPSVQAYLDAYKKANGHPITYLGHTSRHGSETLAGVTAAADGFTLLDNSSKEDDVTYALSNDFPGDDLPGVPKGAVFVGSGTDPLVWVGNWGPEQLNGVVPASWTAKQIADRINQVGLRGSGANLNRVYYRFPQAGDVPVYVLGGSGSSGAGLDAVVAKLTELESKLPTKGTLTLS